jgi:hypothetical protein
MLIISEKIECAIAYFASRVRDFVVVLLGLLSLILGFLRLVFTPLAYRVSAFYVGEDCRCCGVNVSGLVLDNDPSCRETECVLD